MLAGKTRPVRAVKRTNSRNFPHPGKKGSESVIFHAAAHIIHFCVELISTFLLNQVNHKIVATLCINIYLLFLPIENVNRKRKISTFLINQTSAQEGNCPTCKITLKEHDLSELEKVEKVCLKLWQQ